MAVSGFGDLTHRMELLAREATGKAQQDRLKRVGVLSKADINEAVRNTASKGKGRTLSDLSMSGWRRGNPIEIAGRFDVVSDSAVMMSPAPRSRGPMRVLQDGREEYEAGTKREAGLGKVRKDGTRRMRYRTAKRTSGATAGKGTWSDATQIMERKMPARYEAELVRDIARHIRGS